MTARRMGQRLLIIAGVMIGLVAVEYLGIFINELRNPYVHLTPEQRGYVTVVEDDGTQTWTKVGTLCEAGQTENGEWNESGTKYRYSCD